MSRTARAAVLLITTSLAVVLTPSSASACDGFCPGGGDTPSVSTGRSELIASYVSTSADGTRLASNVQPEPLPYQWRLRTPCQNTDEVVGGCVPGDFVACPTAPG